MYFSYCLCPILMVCLRIEMMSVLKLRIAMSKTQIAMRRATGFDHILAALTMQQIQTNLKNTVLLKIFKSLLLSNNLNFPFLVYRL
jgi:hypothetical protein